jgi:hypothetical protein
MLCMLPPHAKSALVISCGLTMLKHTHAHVHRRSIPRAWMLRAQRMHQPPQHTPLMPRWAHAVPFCYAKFERMLCVGCHAIHCLITTIWQANGMSSTLESWDIPDLDDSYGHGLEDETVVTHAPTSFLLSEEQSTTARATGIQVL